MPYDCGYMSIDGGDYAIAVRDQLWVVDAGDGKVNARVPLPTYEEGRDCYWGYAAFDGESLFGSWQLSTASRMKPGREQIDIDYGNEQPLVTSRGLFALERNSTKPMWDYQAAILNPTICIEGGYAYFVGSQDETLFAHPTGRMRLERFLACDPQIMALDAKTGEPHWKVRLPVELANSRNILYLQATENYLVISGSRVDEQDSKYAVAVLDRQTGKKVWAAEHNKGRRGAFSHGEQVHHPVILQALLVCEPVLYDLATGSRRTPPGEANDWSIRRPGHSCGTMAGAGSCLFFGPNNPTLLDLSRGVQGTERFVSISPSRPGCWINIIPADGMVLIPEA